MSADTVTIELPADLAYEAKAGVGQSHKAAEARRRTENPPSHFTAWQRCLDYLQAALHELPERPRPIRVGDRVTFGHSGYRGTVRAVCYEEKEAWIQSDLGGHFNSAFDNIALLREGGTS